MPGSGVFSKKHKLQFASSCNVPTQLFSRANTTEEVRHFESRVGLARVADVYRPPHGKLFLLSPVLYHFHHPRWRHHFATFRFDPHQNTPALQDTWRCPFTTKKQGQSSTKEPKCTYGRILIPAIQTGRTDSGFHRNQTFLFICSPNSNEKMIHTEVSSRQRLDGQDANADYYDLLQLARIKVLAATGYVASRQGLVGTYVLS